MCGGKKCLRESERTSERARAREKLLISSYKSEAKVRHKCQVVSKYARHVSDPKYLKFITSHLQVFKIQTDLYLIAKY